MVERPGSTSRPPLFRDDPQPSSGPVECFGLTFESDEARRAYFMEILKEKLPELRKRPDFPVGEDEDILRLSDPPYYTACPNPFLADFLQQHGTPYDPSEPYHREPFAVDVSEGKTDPLYKAHGYHTKVPHLAIVPSILHYTKPGDMVLDGFCGSGMTGVAAQWCGTAPADYRLAVEQRWKSDGRSAPTWGTRRVILGDLSPAATFIAANYNLPFDVEAFGDAAQQLLDEVQEEIGWMYETLHKDGNTKARINYTVWSEVFSCPECAGEVVFVEEALDEETKRVKQEFPCPTCGASVAKTSLEKLQVSRYDAAIGKTVKAPKRVPSIINYNIGKNRYEKKTDDRDLGTLRRLEELGLPPEVPATELPYMHMTHERARMDRAGVTHLHHFFLSRAAHALSAMWRRAVAHEDARTRNMLLFFVEQAIWGMSVLARYAPTHFSQVNQCLNGVYYVGSQIVDVAPGYILDGKLKRLKKAFTPMPSTRGNAGVTTGDCARIQIPDNSIDYVFTDPPFGENIYYADLNYLVESWHRVLTCAEPEAIVDQAKEKDLSQYQDLVQRCFEEYRRVLKPGRWMTVVFHNSKNAVWNAIQEAMLAAGFVVADVRTLDKKQARPAALASVAGGYRFRLDPHADDGLSPGLFRGETTALFSREHSHDRQGTEALEALLGGRRTRAGRGRLREEHPRPLGPGSRGGADVAPEAPRCGHRRGQGRQDHARHGARHGRHAQPSAAVGRAGGSGQPTGHVAGARIRCVPDRGPREHRGRRLRTPLRGSAS